jgi:hypothetical protein
MIVPRRIDWHKSALSHCPDDPQYIYELPGPGMVFLLWFTNTLIRNEGGSLWPRKY